MAPLASANNPKATPVRVTTTSFDERMSNIEFHFNDVKGTGACSEGVASGRCPVDQQRRPGRHPATAEQRQKRLGWSKEDNKRLFECYIRSEPEWRGYRKRLLDLWKARNINNELTEVTEQRLADQVRQIKNKKWLETVEREEIAIRVIHEHQEIETTELHATDRSDYEHQETETTELPQIHQTMQQHLIPKKNTNVKRNPEFSLLKNYKERSAQNWKPFATGS